MEKCENLFKMWQNCVMQSSKAISVPRCEALFHKWKECSEETPSLGSGIINWFKEKYPNRGTKETTRNVG